jgi:5-methylcytosine-specific restriction protein A
VDTDTEITMPQRPKRYTLPTGTGKRYTPPGMVRKTAHQRGYDSRWRKARLSFLADHPLCAQCEQAGKTEAATVVDHVVSHKGDQSLFWDSSNWRPLCKRCHDVKTATTDGGFGRTTT